MKRLERGYIRGNDNVFSPKQSKWGRKSSDDYETE